MSGPVGGGDVDRACPGISCAGQPQRVCGIGGGARRAAGAGLWPGSDGESGVLCSHQRLHPAIPHHSRQAVLLRPPGLRALTTCSECGHAGLPHANRATA